MDFINYVQMSKGYGNKNFWNEILVVNGFDHLQLWKLAKFVFYHRLIDQNDNPTDREFI